MGKYIWERSIAGLHSLFQEEVFDDLIDLIYGKINKISSYQELFYDFLNGYPLILRKRKTN